MNPYVFIAVIALAAFATGLFVGARWQHDRETEEIIEVARRNREGPGITTFNYQRGWDVVPLLKDHANDLFDKADDLHWLLKSRGEEGE